MKQVSAPRTDHLPTSGVVTLSLPPFLVLLLLFLFQPAPVLGNVTILMVAFYVQDLQVLQPPEGTFHHRAHGQLVKPVQATHVGSVPGPDRAHTDPAQKWSAGDGPSGKMRGKHKRRRRSAGVTGSSSSSVWLLLGGGVTQCSGGKASPICALTRTWGGRHRHLLSACPLALTSRPEAPALPAWSRLGAGCGGAHRQGPGQAGPGTHLGLGRGRLGSDLRPPQLSAPRSPAGVERHRSHCTPTSPSLALWVAKPPAVHILPYSGLSPL